MKIILFSKHTAFTLLETMIVVIVLGVLTVVGIASYHRVVENQRAEEGKQILRNLFRAQKVYNFDKGVYAGPLEIDKLDVVIPSARYFNAPTVSTSASNLAEIARNSTQNSLGTYTLRIDSDGNISCGMESTPYACTGTGIFCSFSCVMFGP